MSVLPFITAFSAWYLAEKYKKIFSYGIAFLTLVFTLHSALIISGFFNLITGAIRVTLGLPVKYIP